jgi:hypothetical protein
MFAVFGVGLLFAKVDELHHEQMKRFNLRWRGLPLDKSRALRLIVGIASLAIAGFVCAMIIAGGAR